MPFMIQVIFPYEPYVAAATFVVYINNVSRTRFNIRSQVNSFPLYQSLYIFCWNSGKQMRHEPASSLVCGRKKRKPGSAVKNINNIKSPIVCRQCDRVPTPKSKYSFFLTTTHHYHFKPFLHMDTSKFGCSNNGNAAPSIEGRYDTTKPTLNLLSTSRNRMNMENERTNKPLDHPSAFSLQLSNLKLSKRLDKNNPISEPGDHTCLHLLLLNICFFKSR
jgi:hypothetical protein